jgi:hypothetical protein
MVIGYDYIFSTPPSKTSEICQLQFLFFAINVRGGRLGDEVTSQTQAIQSIANKRKHRPCKTRVSESLNRQFLTIH